MAVGDIAVWYFRKYARYTRGEAKTSHSLFSDINRLRGSCSNEKDALKVLAVQNMLQFLRASGKKEAADAVVAVYMADKGRAPRKNDISMRIRRFADKYHLDDRTVWRYLNDAKKIYLNMISQYENQPEEYR